MKNLILLIASCFLLACNSGSQKKEAQHSDKHQSKTIAVEPTVLKSAFASSTMMPHEEYALEHLFLDNDKYWSTMLGTGPDEGIMLHFAEPTSIGTIKIHQHEAANTTKIEMVSLYADGQFLLDAINEKEGIKVNKKLSKLYIRIDSTSHISKSTRVENNITVEQFPRTKRLAIRYLQFTNEKEETMRLLAPKRVKGRIEVSSVSEPKAVHSVDKLFDGKEYTAWLGAVDDNKKEMRFYFKNPVRVTDVEVWNGYQRSAQDFQKQGRVERFIFGTDKIYPQHIELEDQKGGQKVKMMTSHMGDMFGLRIKSTTGGVEKKGIGISEILFYDGYEPFVLETGKAEAQKEKRLEEHKNSILGKVLDTRIHNTGYDKASNGFFEKSLLIRSDGTFTFYRKESKTRLGDLGKDNEIAQGGYWQILSETKGDVRLALHGNQVGFSAKASINELIITKENILGKKEIGKLVL